MAEDMSEQRAKLRQEGNGHFRAARFEQALADAGLSGVFTATVWSSVHRCVKPSPRLLQVALEAVGVPPERVLMIGDDHARDIAPAAALGMQTAWVRSPQDVPVWVEAWCGAG